jgi:hypothetical protein
MVPDPGVPGTGQNRSDDDYFPVYDSIHYPIATQPDPEIIVPLSLNSLDINFFRMFSNQ